MNRFVLIAFALLLCLAGPALCLAGVLEHACGTCPEKESCGHEEGCVDDRCSDVALRPASLQEDADPAPAAIVSAPHFPTQITDAIWNPPFAPASASEPPHHRSATPLLI